MARPGEGRLELTGRQGRVLRESAQTAHRWLRTRGQGIGIEAEAVETADMHVHCGQPDRAKTGPSAGCALVTAMASALSGRRVREGTVITGEIGLDDKAGAVGAAHEKVLAAARAEASEVYVPAGNRQEIERRVGNGLRSCVRIRYTTSVSETIERTLEERPERRPAGDRKPDRRDRAAAPAEAGKVSPNPTFGAGTTREHPPGG